MDQITSIGSEDLTQKKPINVIIFQEDVGNRSKSKTQKALSFASREIFKALDVLALKNMIMLNNRASYIGDWLPVSDNYFDDNEYNWTIKIVEGPYPEFRFQNFSTDIDSSIEVHFRYCKERSIQFANIDETGLDARASYWHKEIYAAGIQSLYLLMKGNSELIPTQVRDYQGRIVKGTKLGETERYIFILDGETHIYIVPKKI